MSKKASPVPRPRKKVEYEIHFATRQASKGWQDLLATTRIWFFIDEQAVHLIDVQTHHPNQTKS